MADERTMSAVTMINTAQRNRQKVGVVKALFFDTELPHSCHP